MNKYEKAINTLIKSDIPFFVYKGQTEEMEAPRIFDFYHFEILTLRELVENSKPVKPTYIESHTDEYGELYISGKCGACGYSVYDAQRCCEYCGRRIDWSQEEE